MTKKVKNIEKKTSQFIFWRRNIEFDSEGIAKYIGLRHHQIVF